MKHFFTVLIVLLSFLSLYPQTKVENYLKEKGEVYFRFISNSRKMTDELTKVVSIDNVKGDTVYAYANEKEFFRFEKYKLPYEILPHPGDVKVEMSGDLRSINDWNVYPTYDAYVTMMNQFQTSHPDICRIVEAGTTVQGRKLLFAVISDNVSQHEAEPQFMYSSSMHGDETTGYVLMLRLIDSLLTSYGTDQRITDMVNNTEIWINPLANPDGTYHGGNNTVTGSIRYNGNSIDINRNFPDPADGPHPDGEAWQPETIAMMNIFNANNFRLSANFHGGAEVVNYPWDTWVRLHPDDAWWQQISRKFADTVHVYAPSGYMDDLNNGITNGYDWYRVTGGRQDYMTYFCRGREVTIEISNTKTLSGSQLPTYWNYLRRSFLNYIDNLKYGINGKVTDQSGSPLKAKITITSHDADHSEIYSDSLTGMYYRMIAPGTYTVTVSADSFFTETYNNIVVTNGNAVVINAQLTSSTPVELSAFTASSSGTNVTLNWQTATETNNRGFEVERSLKNSGKAEVIGFVKGYGTTTEKQYYSLSDAVQQEGTYMYNLYQVDFDGTRTKAASSEVTVSLPSKFAVYQNYPNPFNPSTNIQFEIPADGVVKVAVYNIIGQQVKTLLNDFRSKGKQSVVFNASGLTSGVYFYSVEFGGKKEVKQMILVK